MLEFLVCGLPENVKSCETVGDWETAVVLIDKWLRDTRITDLQRQRLEYEKYRIRRLLASHPYDESEALEKAKEMIKDFDYDEFYRLIEESCVDFIVVNRRRKFFERFVQNIGFARSEYRERIRKDPKEEHEREFIEQRIRKLSEDRNPRVYKVHVKLKARVDSEDDYFRVWLPFPKEGFQIEDVKLLYTSDENYFIADNSVPQRTIFFEGTSKEYTVEFEYTVREWINKIDPSTVQESDMKEFLDQEPPHIVFTDYLRWLTKQIVAEETNPYLKAKRIYDWITTRVRYSYVRPYATYENISQYVAENLKGDCGFQALLFITMCRIAGIPARWQSGWYITPYFASPHDWALFYVKPYGWLPADLSFGGARRHNERLRNFYFGNLDSFRMAANDDFMKQFDPPTKFYREDPTDNQLGEAETHNKKVGLQTHIEVVRFEGWEV